MRNQYKEFLRQEEIWSETGTGQNSWACEKQHIQQIELNLKLYKVEKYVVLNLYKDCYKSFTLASMHWIIF